MQIVDLQTEKNKCKVLDNNGRKLLWCLTVILIIANC